MIAKPFMNLVIQQEHIKVIGQSEPAPTSAPSWMDGALIGFSFLSMCHPRITFFLYTFSTLISVFFFKLYFLPAPHPIFYFYFFSLLKFFSPTDLLPPTDLLTYIFKLKGGSSPSTYSSINLKCVILISTHLRAPPPSYPPTL